MHTTLHVAAAQMLVSDNKQKNLDKILACIKKSKKADVICFPELCLQANSDNVQNIQKDIIHISTYAQKYNIYVIFGAYVKIDGKIKNRIFVMDNNGHIIHTYNKRHPYASEQQQISQGRNNKPFLIHDIPCAVINCRDYAFPEYGRSLAALGAQVIFCPAYLMSFPRTKNVLIKIPQVRAFDYMSYFVMVDAVADDTFKKTKICHPLKQIAYINNKEGIIYAILDVGEIVALRQEFKNFRKARIVSIDSIVN